MSFRNPKANFETYNVVLWLSSPKRSLIFSPISHGSRVPDVGFLKSLHQKLGLMEIYILEKIQKIITPSLQSKKNKKNLKIK